MICRLVVQVIPSTTDSVRFGHRPSFGSSVSNISWNDTLLGSESLKSPRSIQVIWKKLSSMFSEESELARIKLDSSMVIFAAYNFPLDRSEGFVATNLNKPPDWPVRYTVL